jgi:phosphoenolpyruvate synthase/pyruvate phosphate dikinase
MPDLVHEGRILVKGFSVVGIVATDDHCESDSRVSRILVVRQLEPGDYRRIQSANAVVCEYGGESDHAAVICRILGKTLVLLPGATSLFSIGELITVDGSSGKVHHGQVVLSNQDLLDSATAFRKAITDSRMSLQVSIISHKEVSAVACASRAPKINLFFQRAELLWLSAGISNPFAFVATNGIEQTVNFLTENLRKCLVRMRPDQKLNFRSLDMRTDEFPVGDGMAEKNPTLGLHGIRRAIFEPSLLEAEIKTVRRLHEEGFLNVFLSLPFINEQQELDQVAGIAHPLGVDMEDLAVFVETAAAVSEIDFFLDSGIKNVFIGTKDLTQMILACDRSNPNVAHLSSSRRRPVVSAIKRVASACSSRGIGAYMFCNLADGPFFSDTVPDIGGLSVCAGEYLLLAA